MECNKDEATRAKSIAERKLEQKDYHGAKKFALKAQSLYPGLEGISQMLTTLDVYISAEKKINGDVDWYAVLNVNPSADDDTIKRQYRKLALLLHPDKNSSIGADGAFKLISEAWNFLSDKEKRSTYNRRRGTHVFPQNVQRNTGGSSAPPRPNQQKVPTHTGGPSAPSRFSQQKVPTHTGGHSAPAWPNQHKVPTHTGGPSISSHFPNCTSKKTSAPKSQNKSVKVPKKPTPAPPHQRSDAFWTTCKRCNTHYEYLKVYRNCTLLCHNCQKPFLASETAPPVNYTESANLWQRRSSLNNVAGRNAYDPGRNVPAGPKSGAGQAGSFGVGNDQQGPLPGKADIGSTKPSIAVKVGDGLHKVQDELKRPHNESNASAGWEGCSKKRKLDDDSSGYGTNRRNAQGDNGPGPGPGLGSCGFTDINHQTNSTRKLTPNETRKLLMVNAQKEIGEKMNDCESRAQGNKEKYGDKNNTQEHRESSSTDNAGNEPKSLIIDVPDSDFHNFDVDRSESSFADNEIWAAYDDDDGMPRLYALINKVVSRDPFELKINWLGSKTNTEFSNIDWVSSGFYKTCGQFSVGRPQSCTSINAFSQRVQWTIGPNKSITILPQKGDSWALYKNWSPDWCEDTPDEVVHKYEVVMVLNEYSEEEGIYVAPLVKVARFSTVFIPVLDPASMKRIPKEEMLRFSHRVPHHLLSREEAPDAPEGSVELDPAATPLELLQSISEIGGV